MDKRLYSIYRKLYSKFGPQKWWPAQDGPFEVMVGAILTQNTNWANVERAIQALRKNRSLSICALAEMSEKKLASLIRPAGYYNLKARRLKNFLALLCSEFSGDIGQMRKYQTADLRKRLLAVNGIGCETADSILLYALNKPIFVVDAYTLRIFSRHKFLPPDPAYEDAQKLFMQGLKKDVQLFNEYHALIVRLAKEYCLKNNPRCSLCPLK